ncbi:MAG: hypothetical protein GF331_16785 [Chitinivibrionales bacterium]|nr:hypothetical protein [Chitinivibrionales bacterium]
MKRAFVVVGLLLLCTLSGQSHAVPGTILHVDPGWGSAPHGIYLIDCETYEWDTLAFGSWGDPAGMMGGFTPDGRTIYTFVRDRGIRRINNDGTGFEWLIRFPISSDRTDAMAINDAGIFWLKDKYVHRLNVQTLVIDTVADLNGIGDGSQWYATSNDGLRAYAWMHNTTVSLEYEPGFADYTLTNMNIWGHGTVITMSGSHIVYDAWSESWGALPGLGHRTWIVYDFETATEVKKFPSGTAEEIETWGVRPCRNDDDYLVFSAGSTFVLNWVTEEKWHIEGAPGHDEFWLGELPTMHTTPAVRLASGALQFVSAGATPQPQTVAVQNSGVGTLDDLTTTIEPAAATWLSVAVLGTGNGQSLEVSVDPSGMAQQTHQASVIVSAPNSANSDTLLVSFTVGTALAAPSNLNATVGYNGVDVTLRWTDNTDTEDGFIVERSDGAAFTEVIRVAADIGSYTDAGLSVGSYTYRVRAYDSSSESDPSNEVPVSIDGIPTFALTAPAAGDTLLAGTRVHIMWHTSVTNNVEIQWSSNGGEHFDVITAHGGITDQMATWGDFTWDIPASTPATTDGYIMVNAYQDRSVSVVVGPLVVTPVARVGGPACRIARHSALSLRTGPSGTACMVSHAEDVPVGVRLLTIDGAEVMRAQGSTNRLLVAGSGRLASGSYLITAVLNRNGAVETLTRRIAVLP